MVARATPLSLLQAICAEYESRLETRMIYYVVIT